MVPSISPFPVLLKHYAVRGRLPPNTELLIIELLFLGADGGENCSIHTFFFQVHI